MQMVSEIEHEQNRMESDLGLYPSLLFLSFWTGNGTGRRKQLQAFFSFGIDFMSCLEQMNVLGTCNRKQRCVYLFI